MTSHPPGRAEQRRTLEEMDASDHGRADTAPAGPNEATLIADAKRGDNAAFGHLVDRYAPMVLSLAYASTLNRSDAEDVAQETFVAAWRGLARFRGDANFSTWLYGLARNRCADRARRAAVRPRLTLYAESDERDRAASEPGDRKTALAILQAASRLPLPQRQAVLMRDVQGLSYDEIASVQDVPVGTVRSRIAGARRAIADQVGEL
jgi:RNA polymerase sigma-70 factor (ECF subfamily)